MQKCVKFNVRRGDFFLLLYFDVPLVKEFGLKYDFDTIWTTSMFPGFMYVASLMVKSK